MIKKPGKMPITGRLYLLTCLLLYPFGEANAAEAWIAEFEPALTRLTGNAALMTFAGPPNYRDIRAGDREERVWILRLNRILNVDSRGADELSEPVGGVKEVQLVFPSDRSIELPKTHGDEIEVTGVLFPAHSGHHHTKVLLDVRSLREVD